MAGQDPRDVREIVLDGFVTELTAERAIRERETGQLFTEWCNVPREHIQEVIDRSERGPERYEILTRWVTDWAVEA
jgi:hypothetical protein